jgi:5-(carboxyamino)imidazole ribonucleotide mutase
MAVGKAGAVNAALLAIEILGLGDPALARRLERWREAKAAELSAKARRVRLGLSARRK